MSLPEAIANPCNECPWRRTAQTGHLGPHTAQEWAELAHSEAIIACHKTIRQVDPEGNGSWDDPAIRQCRGAAIFRQNVCKTPRRSDAAVGPRDENNVFAHSREFIEHHERNVMRRITVEGSTELMVERLEAVLEDVRQGNPGHLEGLVGGREPDAEIEFLPADPSEDPDGDWSDLSVEYREVQR